MVITAYYYILVVFHGLVEGCNLFRFQSLQQWHPLGACQLTKVTNKLSEYQKPTRGVAGKS